MSQAEIAGYMDWRGPGAYTERQMVKIQRIIEEVRRREREAMRNEVHSCGPTCTNADCVAVREAVEAEREACAKACDEDADFYECCGLTHPEDSEERARCFARARAAMNNATKIRTRSTP